MGCCVHKNFQCIRVLVISTAIITLIQGAGYLGLSIWSILIHKCLQIHTKSALEKVVYFIYFRDNECGEVIWPLNDGEQNVDPIMPKVTTIASRTFYIFIGYAIISALWIITSLMVLGAFCSIVNRRAYRVCFLPWLAFILLGSILDVIGTVFFVNDIFYTETAEKALDYLSVKNSLEMMHVLKDYEEYFIYPSIRLSLISSRIVIFWFYNVIAVSFSVKLTKLIIRANEMKNKKPEISTTSTLEAHTDLRTNPNGRNNNNNNHQHQQRNERRSFEPLKSGESLNKSQQQSSTNPMNETTHQVSRQQSLLSNRRIDNVRDYSDINDSPVYINPRHSRPHHQIYSDNQLDKRDSYRDSMIQSSPQMRDSYKGQMRNSMGQSPPQMRDSLHKSQQARDSIRDSINSESEMRKPEKRNINAELRSQLPWSYFGPRSDITAPKHALSHLPSPTDEPPELHEVLPPIPVPDYTLHFPKEDRPSMQYLNSPKNQSSREQSISPSPRNSQSRW